MTPCANGLPNEQLAKVRRWWRNGIELKMERTGRKRHPVKIDSKLRAQGRPIFDSLVLKVSVIQSIGSAADM